MFPQQDTLNQDLPEAQLLVVWINKAQEEASTAVTGCGLLTGSLLMTWEAH